MIVCSSFSLIVLMASLNLLLFTSDVPAGNVNFSTLTMCVLIDSVERLVILLLTLYKIEEKVN